MKTLKLLTLLTTLLSSSTTFAENTSSADTANTVSHEVLPEATVETIRLRDALGELVHVIFDNAGMFNKAATIAAERGHPDLQQKFVKLANDKEKQAEELNSIIVAKGGRAIEAKMDAKGTMMKGYVKIDAALRGLKGLYGALETNMNLSIKYYEKFAEVPADVKQILEKQFAADKELLDYLTTQYTALKN